MSDLKETIKLDEDFSQEDSRETLINAIEPLAMNDWKKTVKGYVIYCKEDRKEAWINAIDALNIADFTYLEYCILMYEEQKRCFIKTAEIMKALDEGESWEQIGARLSEGKKYIQYPIGIIGHMLLAYSKHGIEFVEKLNANTLWMFESLKRDYDEELAKQKGQGLH